MKPRERVTLSATISDPDGDALTCIWWQYADADSAIGTVTIDNSDSPDEASFVVPSESGKQVQRHVHVEGRRKRQLRHRIIFHEGNHEAAKIAESYKAYAALKP